MGNFNIHSQICNQFIAIQIYNYYFDCIWPINPVQPSTLFYFGMIWWELYWDEPCSIFSVW